MARRTPLYSILWSSFTSCPWWLFHPPRRLCSRYFPDHREGAEILGCFFSSWVGQLTIIPKGFNPPGLRGVRRVFLFLEKVDFLFIEEAGYYIGIMAHGKVRPEENFLQVMMLAYNTEVISFLGIHSGTLPQSCAWRDKGPETFPNSSIACRTSTLFGNLVFLLNLWS